MHKLIAVVIVVLLATLPSAGEVVWERYESASFGFSVDLPTGAFRRTARTRGEGVTLLEQNGRGQIDVYGSVNPGLHSVEDFQDALFEAPRIREVTYSRGGESWFVISGYYQREGETADDLIFYAKFMFSTDGRAVAAFEASYPASERRRFDPIVERMEDSLTRPASQEG